LIARRKTKSNQKPSEVNTLENIWPEAYIISANDGKTNEFQRLTKR